MENPKYKNVTYSVAIEVGKSLGEVFSQLIDLRKWWPEDFEGDEVKLNAEFTLKVGEGHFSKDKVIEFEPNKKLVWITTKSLRKSDNYDWSGTKFIFELAPQGNNTQIKFTYDGVVFEHEHDLLVKVCDMSIQMFYDFVVNGKVKSTGKNFTTTVEIEKSPLEVFKTLTTEVSNWWGGVDLTGNTSKLNDEFVVDHPGQHYSKQKLIEVIPNKKVVWLVTESALHWLKDKHEWTNTKMIFEISPNDDRTILHFTHEGLVPEKECYAACEKGWSMVINNWLLHAIKFGNQSPELAKVAEIRNQILADRTK